MLVSGRAARRLAVLLAACLLSAPAFAQRVLRYSDHEPLGGMRTTFLQEVFFAAVEKESSGRLKIDALWNGRLAGAYDALRAAGKGEVADLSMVVPEYMAKDLPLHQIFKSFPTGPSGEQQVSFFRRVYAETPELSAELARNKVEPLFLATGYPVAFFSAAPLRSLSDLQGTKWRTASFWHRDFLRNVGATPVSMPWGPGIYAALQDKALDGLMVNVDSGYELKVHEAAPHVLLSKDLWLGHLYLVVMNRDTWSGLAAEDQAAIRRAAETAYRALGPVMDSSFDSMVAMLKKEGATLRQLTQPEVAAWKAATCHPAVQAGWVKEQEGQGVTEAAWVMEKVSALMDEASRQKPTGRRVAVPG